MNWYFNRERTLKLLLEQPHIIWWAIFTHIVWGGAILFNPRVSSLGILVGVDRFANAGAPARAIGGVLVVVGVMAAIGLILDTYRLIRKGLSMVLLAPQYFLLLSALLTDAQTIWNSAVRGMDIDRAVLCALLGPIIIAAFLHTLAIMERYTHWDR